MKKLLGLGLIVVLSIAIILTGCANGVISTTTTSTTPSTTLTLTGDRQLAEDAVKNSVTFKFDGITGSIKLINATEESPISSFRAMVCTFEFQTAHPGHGDRSGQILAQVITTHSAEVYVDEDLHKVKIAFCDGKWDLMNDKALPVYVSGIVLSGGDTTPAGLMDAPRRFVYQVKKNDGTIVNVGYTAYPPSPAGDAANARISLEFYAGSIQVGDHLEASGTLNEETNTVLIANEGDFIRTSVPKMEVWGVVIRGGETTPEGLVDAPLKFTYTIQKNDGTLVDVSYTIYPPSPAGDVFHPKISLSFYNEGIRIGDYMRAYGTYNIQSAAIVVADEGDLIKTFPEKP